MRILIIVFSMLVNAPLYADYPLEIIELKGRPVEEVLPIIRPFVARDGAVSGINNQLILRTSPDSLRDIRAILERIDTAPRRLLISVRQGSGASASAGGIAADVNARIGGEAEVIVGHPGPDPVVRLRGFSAGTRSNRSLVDSIQTIDGRPAFIATGQSLPVTTYHSYGDGDIRHFQTETRYRDATTGFYALPRLNGERVTVDISPHMRRPGRTPGSLDVMQASTRVSGQLGEWMSLGATVHSDGNRRSGIGFNAGSSQSRQNDIWLKVEEVR